MLTRVAFVLLLLLLTMPAFAATEVVSGVAAIVNEEIITTLELNREFSLAAREAEKHDGLLSAEAAKKLRSDVLNSLIDRKLIRDKIRELNIVISEEEVRQSIEDIKKQNRLSQEALVSALLGQGMTFDQYKAQMKEQLERLRLISQEVKSKISVNEQEVRAYYDSHLADYSEEGGFRARAIFFSLPKNASTGDVRPVMDKVAMVFAEIAKGTDFAELAKKYSDDPNAAKDGGDLGLFKKGEMLAEIETKVVTMKPGEVSELIRTPTGFYIIKLEEIRDARSKPFESVKAQVEELLYRKKSEERFNKWAEELRKGAAVEIKP